MKKLLQGVGEWILNLFHGLLPEIKKAIEVGVDVTEAIKNFDTANPEVADIIAEIIPGNLDDTIKDRIRAALPNIVVELKLVDATLGLTDPNQIMADYRQRKSSE